MRLPLHPPTSRVTLPVLALLLAACKATTVEGGDAQGSRRPTDSVPQNGGGIACTADFRYGLNVAVIDSASGARVAAPLLIIASEGAYADTSQHARVPQREPIFESWPLVGERAGTYDVRVEAPGYRVWLQRGVRISRDQCHVIPVKLTAKLQRAS